MQDRGKKPCRRSIRLRGYDYSQPGAYFVTICSRNRKALFGGIEGGKMCLNPIGKTIKEQWRIMPKRFPYLTLDMFVVMPNHVHAVFFVGAPLAGARNQTIGFIIGMYKSLCVQACRPLFNDMLTMRVPRTIWQRNYYEHIIREETELQLIRAYIEVNPAQWELDSLFV